MKRFFYSIPRIIAEGGGIPGIPDYTERSISTAFELGAGAVSLTVWVTKDGCPVAAPEPQLEKFTSSAGHIPSLTIKEVEQAVVTGGDENETNHLLTLAGILDSFPDNQFIISIIDPAPGSVDCISSIITGKGASGRVLICSRNGSTLERIRRSLPECATGFSLGAIIGLYTLFRTGFLVFKKNFHGDAFVIPENIGTSYVANRNLVRTMKGKGIHVFVRTADTEKAIKRVFQSGADGVITANVPLALEIEKNTVVS